MAPEMLLRQQYRAVDVDLFSLSVILFILLTGLPPFSLASTNDPDYQLIAGQRFDLFWKRWETRMSAKSKNFSFGKDFWDLFSAMA
jgi:serine/threonine protein kinase